ncbi:MAG: ribonuclease E/G [Holosporales bacterium]|jgi:ribonuclease E|nr:ribonuclease E/G [Holosporales bacterium]
MSGKLLIDASCADETRIAVIGADGKLEIFETEHSLSKPLKGNIYLAKIVRIEPSIQAAFIDYGTDKHGFLPFTEIHYEYFSKNSTKANGATVVDSDHIENGNDPENTGEKRNISHTRIQGVITQKQVVLVQAEKEIRGNKCAFFSTFISLPGRYCVLAPNPPKGKKNAVSKKIEASEKERLKEIIQQLDVPAEMNCIVRTAGENRTKQEIKRDFEYLRRLWDEIREKMANSTAPSLVYEEGNIIKRGIRDLYQRNMDGIVVHGMDAYKEAKSFMNIFTPSQIKKVALHEDTASSLFCKYGIEDSVSNILSPVVQLPSGGTIVINATEALTAIDVNSGKMRNERNFNGTALRTNLEAVTEIAIQIRLRDIAGIIVVDFIDMDNDEAVAQVEKKMRESMKGDSANVRIGKISQFGLIEMSRQRMRMSVAESSFVQCPHCNGCGRILSDEAVAISVIRKAEAELIRKNAQHITVEVAKGVDLFILNHKRRLISELETTRSAFVEIVSNPSLLPTDCNVTVSEPRVSEYLAATRDKRKQNGKPDNNKPSAENTERNQTEEPDAVVTAATNSGARNSSQRKRGRYVKRKAAVGKTPAANPVAQEADTPTNPKIVDTVTESHVADINAKPPRSSWIRKIFTGE